MLRAAIVGLVVGSLVLGGAADAPAAYSRGGPYLDYAARAPLDAAPNVKLQRDGVARVLYPFGWRRNPITTAQIGLQAHAYHLVDPRRRAHRRKMVRAAAGLLRSQRGGAWLYRFPFTVAGMGETLRPPWKSAMAQGVAMSLLTRAYSLTGRRAYLRSARRALRPYGRSVRRGGVVRRYAGHRWYEEYPTSTPSYVLNGFGFALLGLYDLARWSSHAARLYRDGREALLAALPRFDAGTTSWYHLGHLTEGSWARFPASPAYNRIHVQLLHALNYVDPDSRLRRWRDRFGSYDR